MGIVRLHCPPMEANPNLRIQILFENIKEWMYSEALVELITMYGGKVPLSMNLKDYIYWVNDFVEIWDFRKKQSNGGERWSIGDDKESKDNRDAIMDMSYQLGLIKSLPPLTKPDYILPLGGARLANLARAQEAKKITDLFSDHLFSIVALSGKRPINEIERPYIQQYAPDAVTEYDAVNGGLEHAFEISGCEYCETNFMTNNINLQWSKRKYTEKYKGHDIYSIAAPSSDPNRRANSYDTFETFMEHFSVKEGQKILLVTSCIYVPFQLMKFIPISLEKNIMVDCVGVSKDMQGSQFILPANYLQEVKGTVNAIKKLVDLYL